MPIYELWGARNGTEYSLFRADIQLPVDHATLTLDVSGRQMRLAASFLARGWEAAKAAQRSILGWGKDE